MELAIVFLALMVVVQSFRVTMMQKKLDMVSTEVDHLIGICKDLLIVVRSFTSKKNDKTSK